MYLNFQKTMKRGPQKVTTDQFSKVLNKPTFSYWKIMTHLFLLSYSKGGKEEKEESGESKKEEQDHYRGGDSRLHTTC